MKIIPRTKTLICVALIFLSQFCFPPHTEPGTAPFIIHNPLGKQVGSYRNSYALVMAVYDYAGHWPDRPGALQDAGEIKSVLQSLGFDVTLVSNPDAESLRKELVGFINLHGKKQDNRLLIYFSGHCYNLVPPHGGDEMEYLVPASVPHPRKNLMSFRNSSLSLFHLDIYARNILANHTLFLLKGCRKGTALDLQNTVAPTDITEAAFKPARQFILFDGSAEADLKSQVGNKSLEDALKGGADLNDDGYITASELAKFLRNDAEETHARKEKLVFGTLEGIAPQTGNFIFPLSPSYHNLEQAPGKKVANSNSQQQLSKEKAEAISTLGPNLGKTPTRLAIKILTNQPAEQPINNFPETLTPEPSSEIRQAEELAKINHKRLVFWPPEQKEQIKPSSIQEETFAHLEDLETEDDLLRKTLQPSPLKTIGLKGKKPKSRWVTKDDGTALDTWSGLIWMVRDFRNIEKRPPNNWGEALSWAKKINDRRFAGYSDWRVPTIEEMKFIYSPDPTRWVFSQKRKVGYPEIFENGGGYWYWSAEEQNMEEASAFGFYSGVVLAAKAKNSHNFGSIRLVRMKKDKL